MHTSRLAKAVHGFSQSWSEDKQVTHVVPKRNALICSSGQDASKAAKLIASLVGKVYYVQGGADSWQAGSPHTYHSHISY